MAKDTDYDYIDEKEDTYSEEELEKLEDRGDNVEDEEEGEESEEGDSEEEDDGGSEEQEADESDAEDDDVDEEEEEEPPVSKHKIPKYRLDQEIEKNKALKERERWLEEQLAKLINSNQNTKDAVEKEVQETPFDFEAAEEAYITAIVEGDTAEAKKIRKQIDSEKAREIKAQIAAENEEAQRKAKVEKEEVKFQSLVENFESKYSFFNPKKKGYNEDAVDTVNTLMAGFMAKGLSKADALEKAVNKVVPMFHKEVAKPEESKKRTIDQRKKNIQTMKKTPPQISGRKGQKEIPDVDVNNMDEKEFAKLAKDKRALAKLRGDIF